METYIFQRVITFKIFYLNLNFTCYNSNENEFDLDFNIYLIIKIVLVSITYLGTILTN